MDIKKTISTLAIFFAFIFNVYSQQPVKEIKIGDKIPDLVISGIINQSNDKVRLNELYKSGLLIIDFWFTTCVPCIQEMKFLDALKGENPDKFNVLMVTYEDSTVIKKFLSRPFNQDVKTSNLIIATKDTLLRKLFPHTSCPHNVWIDRNGIVKAITSGSDMTKKNILGFNNSAAIAALRVKKDNVTFDQTKEFHLGDSIYTYRSIITPNIDGIGGEGGIRAGKGVRYFQFNKSITHLYWNAYSNFTPGVRFNLMEVHTRDSIRLFYPVGDQKDLLKGAKYKDYRDWAEENVFCYALTLPKRVPDSVLRKYMFNDLERQFNVKAKLENRNIPCMVITKMNGDPLKPSIRDTGSMPKINLLPGGKFRIKDAKISDVMNAWYRLNQAKILPHPFVVEVKASEDIYFDAVLDLSTENIEQGITPDMIYRQLNKYGFRFERKIRSYPILVLYDQNK